jgi:hypothetical protein
MKRKRFSQRDEEQMTSYLLGRLPESDRETVRERLLAEPDYFQSMQAMETELCDSFVRGELSGEDKAAMERMSAESEYWAQRIRIARALHTALPPRAAEPRTTFRWLPWSITAAAVAASMVLINNNQRSPGTIPTAPPSASNPVVESKQPVIAEWTLAQATLRDGVAPPVFQVNKNVKLIHIQVDARELDAKRQYRAVLLTAAGKPLFTQEALTTTGPSVDFWISVAMLPSGAYELALTPASPGTAPEPETAYAFRVENR